MRHGSTLGRVDWAILCKLGWGSPQAADFARVVDGAEVDGTGVGLTIVKRVVEEHGGRVWVESTVGTGSAFYVLLPSQVGQPQSETPAHPAA